MLHGFLEREGKSAARCSDVIKHVNCPPSARTAGRGAATFPFDGSIFIHRLRNINLSATFPAIFVPAELMASRFKARDFLIVPVSTGNRYNWSNQR